MVEKVKSALIVVLIIVVSAAYAQRKITGVVYRDGKPAAGVEVSAHRAKGSFFTSFDGKYELQISEKTKYLKFVFIDIEKKLDIEGNNDKVINFYLGEKPAPTVGSSGEDIRSHATLLQDNDLDYLNNYSLYDQFYKQKDYRSALEPWSFIYEKYPKSTENTYIKGVRIYESMIEGADDAKKEELINKILEIYDKRIEYFGRKGYNNGRKAISYLNLVLNDNMSDDERRLAYKRAVEWMDIAVREDGDKVEAAVLVLIMQVANFLFKLGDYNSDKVIANYEMANSIVENNLKSSPDDENYNNALDAINRLFEISGAADCDALNRLYSEKFQAEPENVGLLRKILKFLNSENCTESRLFADAAEKLYELEPSAGAARSMARLFLKRQDFDKAAEYYREAIGTEDDNELKAVYLFELASLTYAQKNFKEARDIARKSIALNPNSGKIYILIGRIYAATAKSISNKEFEQRMVYCLAVDYFNKAKAIDPEAAEDANNEINSYSRHFPNKENAFFEGFSEGADYTVGGWINEKTKVRVR